MRNSSKNIIKIFLQSIKPDDQLSQHKIRELEACGLVQDDLDIARHYRENLPFLEELLTKTNQTYAPWVVVESDDEEYAEVTVLRTLVDALTNALNQPMPVSDEPLVRVKYKSMRTEVDLDVKVADDDYKDKLEKYQAKLRGLQCEMYRKKKRLVIVFEGRDASGKGGDINRFTQTLNPRTYEVVPVFAPNDTELSHHYLWRFYRRLPLPGHIAIFDRSWYGRVLVERVKNITPPSVWKRAYKEISDFEAMLVDNDTIIVKLWLEVDKKVQLQRFIERVEDPRKIWKITQDDWEAREMWDQYTEAIDEMLSLTSTPIAPWTIIESNDKNHSRLKTLKTIIDQVEDKL
jgi:polyphosphate kinase 2 (PPK2 family)